MSSIVVVLEVASFWQHAIPFHSNKFAYLCNRKSDLDFAVVLLDWRTGWKKNTRVEKLLFYGSPKCQLRDMQWSFKEYFSYFIFFLPLVIQSFTYLAVTIFGSFFVFLCNYVAECVMLILPVCMLRQEMKPCEKV